MSSRKYGTRHRQIRRAMLASAVGSPCVRCGERIGPNDPVDLDHDDAGIGYRGWAHASCNRRAGGLRSKQLQQQRKMMSALNDFVIGVEVASDREHTSIATASRHDDGRVEVQVLYLAGADTARHVHELAAGGSDVRGVVLDASSESKTLIPALEELRVDFELVRPADVAAAHGVFRSEAKAKRLKLPDVEEMRVAFRFASGRSLSGSEALDRRRAAVDVSPLFAAEFAVWRFLNPKPPKANIFLAVT